MARKPPDTLEMTEMVVLHGESLRGAEKDQADKLERIKEALREKGIDFVDQPDSIEVWVGTKDRDAVIAVVESLGYEVDLYEI